VVGKKKNGGIDEMVEGILGPQQGVSGLVTFQP
jgi:hypothetical protein